MTKEYRQLREKWYNYRERALIDLSRIKLTDYSDHMLYLGAVVEKQVEIRIWKQALDEMDINFSPTPIEKPKA